MENTKVHLHVDIVSGKVKAKKLEMASDGWQNIVELDEFADLASAKAVHSNSLVIHVRFF